MIALGLKVDEKSFQQGQNAFTGLTNSALKLGAVLASKLAIDKVVGDFKNAGTQLDNFNKLTGLSTQNVQALGQAFTAIGGNASDALGTYQKIQDLMKSPMTGEIKWAAEAAKYGFDPNLVIDPAQAKSTSEALANIAEGLEKLPPLQKRLAAQAMGFSDDEIRILIKGREEVEKLADHLGKLGIMTGKQVEDAARLTKATSELNLVFTDIGNTIAGELTPAFAEMAEDFTQFYRDNKELIHSGLESFFGAVAKNIEGVAVAMALMGGASALKGLAALKAILSLGNNGAPPVPGAPGGPGPKGGPGSPPWIPIAASTTAVGLLAALYSPSLNDGENDEVAKIRMKNGGADGAGAVIDYLRSKGLSDTLAKGIAANVQAESSFDPKAVGDGGKAYGLLQLHPPRQADFAAYSGKDIRQSTWQEQLDFAVYEATKGNENKNWANVENSQSPAEAAYNYSRYVIRPGKDEATKELRAQERAQIAAGYGSPVPQSQAPVLDLSDPDQWKKTQAELASGLSIIDQIDAWAKSQRRAPEQYTASDVVTPAASPPAPAASSAASGQSVQNVDNRQFHIHGADTEKVKQLYNEQLSTLIDQTTQNFWSPEK